MKNGLINKSLIMKAWTFLREKEMSIPNETLDFMRDVSINKLDSIEINNVNVPLDVIEQILKYCEVNQIYDKLSNYGDFYYKLNQIKHKFVDNNCNI
jgi:hypothetical protein